MNRPHPPWSSVRARATEGWRTVTALPGARLLMTGAVATGAIAASLPLRPSTHVVRLALAAIVALAYVVRSGEARRGRDDLRTLRAALKAPETWRRTRTTRRRWLWRLAAALLWVRVAPRHALVDWEDRDEQQRR